jgi:hypothetical protein
MSLSFNLLDSRRDLCQHTPALVSIQVRCRHSELLSRFVCVARQAQPDAKSTAEEYRS